MLKQRALSALIFVPLFLGIALLGGVFFDIFLGLILAFAGYEYAGMLRSNGHQVSLILVIGSIITIVLLRMFSNASIELLVFPAILAVFGFFALWKYEHGDQQALESMVFQLFGVFYIGVLGAYGITLNHIGANGNLWVLVSIALVWLVDAGAFFIGTRFGKRLVLPQLSPKKTWEGFIGGILVGLLSGLLIGLILNGVMPELGPWKGALLGLIIGPVAFFGDALMSLLKRTMGTKDTGKLLPGHGGVLDRLDSMLWAMVVAMYFVMLLG